MSKTAEAESESPSAHSEQSSRAEPRPRRNGKRSDESSYWERAAGIPAQDWGSRFIQYLYRLAPKIDLGEKHFAAKYAEFVDENEILNRHGSGRYQLVLNDTKERRTIANISFAVYDPTRPPKIKLDQLINCPENEPYLQWLKEARDAAAMQARPPIANGAIDSNAIQQLTQLVAKLAEQKLSGQPQNEQEARLTSSLVDWALKQAAEDRSADSPNKLVELISAIKQLTPAPAPVADPASALEKLATVIEKLSPKPPPEKDTLSEIDRLVAIMDRLRPQVDKEPLEFAGGSEASTWERVGSLLVNLLQPAMGPIGTAIATKLTGAPPTSSAVMDSSALNGTIRPVSSPPGAEASTAASQPVDPRLKPVSPELVQAQQLLLLGGDRIIAKLREGMKGHEFADVLIAFYGQDAWAFMARLGPDKLMEVLQSVPLLWEQIQVFGETYLREWCRQFVDYEAELAKEEEQEQTESTESS